MIPINPTAQDLKQKLKSIAEKSGKLSKKHPQVSSTITPVPVGQPATTSTPTEKG